MKLPLVAILGLVGWAWMLAPTAAQEGGTASLQLDLGVVDGLSNPHFEVRNLSESLLWEQFAKLSDAEEDVKANQVQLIDRWLAAHKKSRDLEVKMRLERLIRAGVLLTEYKKGKGFLGITLAASQTLHEGRVVPSISVQGVLANTAAEKAGIRMNDHILRFGDLKVRANQPLDEVIASISSKEAGDVVEIERIRNGKRKVMKVVLGERPASVADRIAYPEFFREWWEKNRK